MNRNVAIQRTFEAEGSERSHQLAAALAAISDPDFLERLLQLKNSLDAWGGQAFIAAARKPIDPRTGQICEHNTPGREYVTLGYVVHYGHRATAIRGQAPEPDEPLGIEIPEPTEEPSEDEEPTEGDVVEQEEVLAEH